MTYNSLQGIFTTTYDWLCHLATLLKMMVQKGGQVTKPIIVVKMPCKLLYVIQVKGFLIKCSTSWPYLISEFLVAYTMTIVASDRPCTFLQPGCFCLAYHCFL